jgi:hypothetical protein
MHRWLSALDPADMQRGVPPEFFKAIDSWRRKQEDLPSRAEAIRRLVELGLKAERKR